MRVFAILAAVMLISTGCNYHYETIPPAHKALVCAPSGEVLEVRGPGQIDIGVEKNGQMGNYLIIWEDHVLLQKEQFLPKESPENTDKTDHRWQTRNKEPVVADVRHEFVLPEDLNLAENRRHLTTIIRNIRPKLLRDRVFAISLEEIYAATTKSALRGGYRVHVAQQYEDYDFLWEKFLDGTLNEDLKAVCLAKLEECGSPFRLAVFEVSNLKPDDKTIEARNNLAAAEAQGEAIQAVRAQLQDPAGRMIYFFDRLEKTVEKAGQSGSGLTVFLTVPGLDGGSPWEGTILPGQEGYTPVPIEQPKPKSGPETEPGGR